MEVVITLNTNLKMRDKLFLLQELDLRLNLDNFFSIDIIRGIGFITLMAHYSERLEKLLYISGYQFDFDEEKNYHEYRDSKVRIILHPKK